MLRDGVIRMLSVFDGCSTYVGVDVFSKTY